MWLNINGFLSMPGLITIFWATLRFQSTFESGGSGNLWCFPLFSLEFSTMEKDFGSSGK